MWCEAARANTQLHGGRPPGPTRSCAAGGRRAPRAAARRVAAQAHTQLRSNVSIYHNANSVRDDSNDRSGPNGHDARNASDVVEASNDSIWEY